MFRIFLLKSDIKQFNFKEMSNIFVDSPTIFIRRARLNNGFEDYLSFVLAVMCCSLLLLLYHIQGNIFFLQRVCTFTYFWQTLTSTGFLGYSALLWCYFQKTFLPFYSGQWYSLSKLSFLGCQILTFCLFFRSYGLQPEEISGIVFCKECC